MKLLQAKNSDKAIVYFTNNTRSPKQNVTTNKHVWTFTTFKTGLSVHMSRVVVGSYSAKQLVSHSVNLRHRCQGFVVRRGTD